MYSNIKRHLARTIFMGAMFSLFFLSRGNVCASQGTDLAKEMLQKIQACSTKQAEDAFLQKAAQEKSLLSSRDRIDYAEYLYNVVASSAKTNNEQRAWLAISLLPGGISEQEIRTGRARLLASDDSLVLEGAKNLDFAPSATLPNGEVGQDISVFNLALHDPKVPQDRLIEALFKLAPVESAQWFSDHAGLPANDRAALEPELQTAWRMHHALSNPNADKQTKAILGETIRKPMLNRWLTSQSWILRSLANGLLQKHEEWQTPDLKKAMQPVQIPTGLQITSGQQSK